MIVDRDVKPEKNIYYLGAKILEALSNVQFGIIAPAELFYVLQNGSLPKITFGYFLLALDWLYILELVVVNEDGDLVRCF